MTPSPGRVNSLSARAVSPLIDPHRDSGTDPCRWLKSAQTSAPVRYLMRDRWQQIGLEERGFPVAQLSGIGAQNQEQHKAHQEIWLGTGAWHVYQNRAAQLGAKATDTDR